MSLARNAALLMCAAVSLLAAPNLSTIQDTIYNANGTMFNGVAVITWMPFDADDNSKIGLQSLTVRITSGIFRVQLVPNSDVTPATNYTVTYNSSGLRQFTEVWSVPPSTTILRVKDVRVGAAMVAGGGGPGGVVQPPSQSPINESTVIGLLTDLSLRPIRGAGYTTGRAAVVDDSGAIDSVEGNLSDCVHVDGSSGSCFDATQLPGFVYSETPGGVVDGTNASFTLAGSPTPATSLVLYRNGLMQAAGGDYNVQTDGSILFVSASVPQPRDVLTAQYMTAASSSSPITSPQVQAQSVQVLCSGSGAGTTVPNLVVLGACTIPANTLAIGDRVEVRFLYSHQGTTRNYSFKVNWGSTTMVQRNALIADTVITGHGDATIGPGGTTLDIQTWGTTLALSSGVASASDPINAPIVVNFLGAISSAGSDIVSLQNYTVLRYPAQ